MRRAAFAFPRPRSPDSFAICLLCMALAACGGGGGGGGASTASPTPELQLIAGSTSSGGVFSGAGSTDGTGTAARFQNPRGVTADATGNLYVADPVAHTIRKITPDGVVTTLAGSAGFSGNADGVGANARFSFPTYITVGTAGNLYVTDGFTIRMLTPDGVVTTLAGMAGVAGSADGTGAGASFNYPSGITADSAGNLYVAEINNQTIRKITTAGVVTTLAGAATINGSADGVGTAARFYSPNGIAADAAGNLYVTDMGNATIRKITPTGVVTTLAGMPGIIGSTDGTGAAARFSWPTGIAVDASGNLSVVDGANHTIRRISPLGEVTTLAGTAGVSGSADGTGAAARFYYPAGIAADAAGKLYVADENNHLIRAITPTGVVTTLAGTPPAYGSADGTGPAARFSSPTGIAADTTGNLYVADSANHTIRRITPAGIVTTLAGTAGIYGSSDGTGAAARFYSPYGIAVDTAGSLYVADSGNNAVRKITQAGVVSTVPGTAGLFHPTGIAVDSSGNLYVAVDTTIRKVTPDGVATILAGADGVGGYVDGTGTAARFRHPLGITTDTAGNLYVTDFLGVMGDFGLPSYNLDSVIRKITPQGVVTTLAGAAGLGGNTDGTGSGARFNGPEGIAADSAGNLYVADSGNYTIRKITPAGVVTTVAGVAGQRGIVLGVLPGGLDSPHGVALIDSNTLAVTTDNSVLRLILP